METTKPPNANSPRHPIYSQPNDADHSDAAAGNLPNQPKSNKSNQAHPAKPPQKKTKRRFFLVALILAVAFIATASAATYHFFLRDRSLNISEAPPLVNTKPTQIKYSTSHLNLSLDVNHKRLAAEINNVLEQPISLDGRFNVGKSSLGRFDMDYNFLMTRAGEVSTRAQGEDLFFRIPVSFRVELRPIGDLFFRHTQRVLGNVVITVKVRLGFHKNWQPYLTVDLHYDWKQAAYTYILGAKIILSDLIEQNLKATLQKLINKTMANMLDFPKEINKGWNALHEPVRINAEPPLWLIIQPQKIYFPPLSGDEHVLKVRFAVQVRLATLLTQNTNDLIAASAGADASNDTGGGAADASNDTGGGADGAAGADAAAAGIAKKLTPLPALENTLPPSDRFLIRLPIVLSYQTIVQQLKKQVVGKKFPIKQENVLLESQLQILDFKMYPSSNETLCLGVFIDNRSSYFLSTRGWIYFLFRPEFDREKNTIVFADINFTRQLSNTFLETGTWILGDTLLSVIKSQVAIDLNEPFQDALQTVNKKIFNKKLSDGVFLKSNLSELGIERMDVSQDAFLLYTRLAGKLAIVVEEKADPKTEAKAD